MNNIHQQAYNIYKKPSKENVSDILKDLWEKAEEDDKEKIASVFKYFQLPNTAKPKNTLQWVAKARGKEATRPYLHEIYATGQEAVATNGHILLLAPHCTEKAHYITPEGESLEGTCMDTCTFPDWGRVIPEYSTPALRFDDFEIGLNGDYVLKNNKQSLGFDKKYFDIVFSFGGKAKLFWNQLRIPMLVVFDDGRKAAIMPKGQGV